MSEHVSPQAQAAQSTPISFLSTATSQNGKTGNVPQIMIGATREESIRSCRNVGCPLLHRKHGGQGGQPGDISREEARAKDLVTSVCYSQSGTGAIAHASAIRKAERTVDTSQTNEGLVGLANSLKYRIMSAKIARLGTIGDPAELSRDVLHKMFDMVEAAGLRMIGYTHGWKTKANTPVVEFMKRRVMASCDTLEQADEAVDMGWQAAVTLPSTTTIDARPKTPAGRPVIICPAMTSKARYKLLRAKKEVGTLTSDEEKVLISIRMVTCNTCRLCSGDKADIIGFPLHDNTQRHTNWRD